MNIFDSLLKSEFTADDVVQILNKRGIKLERQDKECILIEYAGQNFEVFFNRSRLSIRLLYTLEGLDDTMCTLLAINKVHSERWSTKLYTVRNENEDEETNEVKIEKWLVIIYTGWCFDKSSFEKQFDFAIQALQDSANFFIQSYREYENEVKPQQNPIGFNAKLGEEGNEARVNGKKGKIGFV